MHRRLFGWIVDAPEGQFRSGSIGLSCFCSSANEAAWRLHGLRCGHAFSSTDHKRLPLFSANAFLHSHVMLDDPTILGRWVLVNASQTQQHVMLTLLTCQSLTKCRSDDFAPKK